MAKGDIVLIVFPFTDLTGSKLRPGVVLVESNLDLVVCFITTQLSWKEPTDIQLTPNSTNNLKQVSLVRISKLATLDRQLVKGLLGNLSTSELEEINSSLKSLFQLT